MLPIKEQAYSFLHLCFLEKVEENRLLKANAAETRSAALQELRPRIYITLAFRERKNNRNINNRMTYEIIREEWAPRPGQLVV